MIVLVTEAVQDKLMFSTHQQLCFICYCHLLCLFLWLTLSVFVAYRDLLCLFFWLYTVSVLWFVMSFSGKLCLFCILITVSVFFPLSVYFFFKFITVSFLWIVTSSVLWLLVCLLDYCVCFKAISFWGG